MSDGTPTLASLLSRDQRIGLIAGFVVIFIMIWFVAFSAFQPSPGEIVLKNSIERVPNGSMRAFSLRLPYTGVLEIEAITEERYPFSVYLVEAGTTSRPDRKGFRIVREFTAERISNHRQSAHVERGEYQLTFFRSGLLQDDVHAAPIVLRVKLVPRRHPRAENSASTKQSPCAGTRATNGLSATTINQPTNG